MRVIFALFFSVLLQPAEQIEQLSDLQPETQKWLSESLEGDVQWLEFKPWSVYGVVTIKNEQKFFKLHEKEKAFLELQRGMKLQHHLPAIIGERVISLPPFECLIQPYVQPINNPGGMFFDLFYLYPEQSLSLLRKIIESMKSLVFKTLEKKTTPVLNDKFYFDRLKNENLDGVSGRIETYYKGKKFLNIPWEELIKYKFEINGIEYDLSLSDILKEARESLNPDCLRPIAFCHGDWHDMNICIIEGNFYFIDCDLSGENDPIGDAAVFLVYNAVHGDYLGPKYFRRHFHNRNHALEKLNLQRNPIRFILSEKKIIFQGPHLFGASLSRKDAARCFIDDYFDPLLKKIYKQGFSSKEIDSKVRAALLMRLLAVYNLTKLDLEDQARILVLLIQTVGQREEPPLAAFWRHL